jgi:hypothetical protein
MTRRLPVTPSPGPLERYANRFDDLFGSCAQREVPTHFRAVCTDGDHVGSLDQGQPNLERLDADLPDRGGQRMAGSRSLAAAARC